MCRVKNDFARSCFRSHNPTPSSISGDLHIRDWIVSYAPAPDDILWFVCVSFTFYCKLFQKLTAL